MKYKIFILFLLATALALPLNAKDRHKKKKRNTINKINKEYDKEIERQKNLKKRAEERADTETSTVRDSEKREKNSERIAMLMKAAGDAVKAQNYPVALENYRKAASLGDPTAQAFLGSCYYYGMYGLQKDLSTAAKFYRKAAQQGNKMAQEQLARCYADKAKDATNHRKKTKQYKKSAEWSKKSKKF